jgi:hypothetical protein
MNPIVQPYRPELRDALFAFYARSYPRRDRVRYAALWHWQYFENPLEPADADRIWVVCDGDQIVGHLGTMAATLQLGGETIAGRWASDLLIDAPYRGHRLGEALIAAWTRSSPVVFAKGLSEPAIRLFQRLGWQTVPLRRITQLALDLRALSGRLLRNQPLNTVVETASRWIGRWWAARQLPTSGPLCFQTVDAFPSETDALAERIAQRTALAIVRDRRFLQWRYAACPVFRYHLATAWLSGQMCGYAALSVRAERGFRRGFIHAIDLDTDDTHAWRSFLAYCLLCLHDHRADEAVLLPHVEPAARAAAALGFLGRGHTSMMLYDARTPQRAPDGLLTDSNVQLGDGDDW